MRQDLNTYSGTDEHESSGSTITLPFQQKHRIVGVSFDSSSKRVIRQSITIYFNLCH